MTMSYRNIKWIIFITLFLTVPVMLFLIQVVMFMPAIFLLSGIVYMIPKLANPSHMQENLSFIAIFGVHILLYSGVFYLLSIVFAKLISLAGSLILRKIIVIALCSLLIGLTFFPIYGGGGHGPMELMTLPNYLRNINKSYGSFASIIVYGSVFLIITLRLAIKKCTARNQ